MIRAIASVASLLTGMAILLTGLGLQSILLPVRATLEGFSTVAVGFVGATYFLGFTYGCWKGSDLIERAGHVRVFAAMTALASASPLLHGLWVNLWSWLLLRVISGFCFAVLYVVIESWLNERSTNANRGQIFSAYILIHMTVLAIGQQMLLLKDPQHLDLFALTSVLVSLAAIPVLMSRAVSPTPIEQAGVNLRKVFLTSPAGMLGSLAAGLAAGAFWALAPVFTVAYFTDIALTVWFMTAVVLGGAAGQFPLGWLSDRIDRRYVLSAISVAAVMVGIFMWLLAPRLGLAGLAVSGFLWGALAFPVYPISAAHANDRAQASDYVEISSGVLLMYGMGAVTGPFLASALMTLSGTASLFLFTAVVHASLTIYLWLRSLRRIPPEAEQQTDFSDALASVITASNVYEEEHLAQQSADALNPGQQD